MGRKLEIIKEVIREQQSVEEQTEAEKHTWFAQQHTNAANQLDGRIATLNDRFNSAAKQSKEFPGVSTSTSIEAHRRNIAFWQAKADGHREDAAWHTGKAKELTPAVESYIDEAKKEEDEETPKAPSAEPTAYHWNKAKDVYDVPRTVTVTAIRGYGNHIKTGERLPLKDLVIAHARGLAKGAANFSSQFTPEQKRDYIKAKIARLAAAKKAREGSS